MTFFYRFWPFFECRSSLNWVSSLQTFPKKKTASFFLFKIGGTKQKLPRVSEWVPPYLFRGKNTVPLVQHPKNTDYLKGSKYPQRTKKIRDGGLILEKMGCGWSWLLKKSVCLGAVLIFKHGVWGPDFWKMGWGFLFFCLTWGVPYLGVNSKI